MRFFDTGRKIDAGCFRNANEVLSRKKHELLTAAIRSRYFCRKWRLTFYRIKKTSEIRRSIHSSFGKNQLLLSQLTLKNVLDLVAGSHQIVSLTVVKGGKDGTDAVGDDIHIVRSLFNPA